MVNAHSKLGLREDPVLLMEFHRTPNRAVDLVRAIKRALDPKNIMNPGKIFSLRRLPVARRAPAASWADWSWARNA